MQPGMLNFKMTVGVLALLLNSLPASSATDTENRLLAQTKRLQQQLRIAEQEKAQLAQQKSEADNELKIARENTAAAKRREQAATLAIAESAKSIAALKLSLEDAKQEKIGLEATIKEAQSAQSALVTKLGEMERTLAEQRQIAEAEKSQLDAALTNTRAVLSGCRERNERMYKLGTDLIEKYEQKSCTASLLQLEPFTGLKRAQIERMVEEEREKLDKEQFILAPGKEVPSK